MLRIIDETALLPALITRWHVIFWRAVNGRRWHHALAPGPYKHVSAIGYSQRCNVWIHYNPADNGDHIEVVSNDETFPERIEYLRARADLLAVEAVERLHPPWRPGFWCVPQVIRLLGAKSGALTPAGLFRDLVRQGAKQSDL